MHPQGNLIHMTAHPPHSRGGRTQHATTPSVTAATGILTNAGAKRRAAVHAIRQGARPDRMPDPAGRHGLGGMQTLSACRAAGFLVDAGQALTAHQLGQHVLRP